MGLRLPPLLFHLGALPQERTNRAWKRAGGWVDIGGALGCITTVHDSGGELVNGAGDGGSAVDRDGTSSAADCDGESSAADRDGTSSAADRDGKNESDDATRYDVKFDDNDEEARGVRAAQMAPILLVRYEKDGYGQEGISARDLHGELRSASGTARCTIYRPGCKLHVAPRAVAPPKVVGGGAQPTTAAAPRAAVPPPADRTSDETSRAPSRDCRQDSGGDDDDDGELALSPNERPSGKWPSGKRPSGKRPSGKRASGKRPSGKRLAASDQVASARAASGRASQAPSGRRARSRSLRWRRRPRRRWRRTAVVAAQPYPHGANGAVCTSRKQA